MSAGAGGLSPLPGGPLSALQSPPPVLGAPSPLPLAAASADADAAAEAAALAADAAEEAAGLGAAGGGAEEGSAGAWGRGDLAELDEDEAREEAEALEAARAAAALEARVADSAEADAAAEAAALAEDGAAEAAEAPASGAEEGGEASPKVSLRPSRPSGAPPFSQDEINAAKKALDKLYKAQAAELKAAAKRAEAEERKRKAIAEAQRIEAERKAEAARLEAARLAAERELQIQLSRQGKLKARKLEPPPPPKDPPRWMALNATTILVPRGRLHLKINRVTGLGLFLRGGSTGSGTREGSGGSRSGTATGFLSSMLGGGKARTVSYDGAGAEGAGGKGVRSGSVYMRFELHLGGGVIMAARSETNRNQALGDFEPPGAEVEFRLTQGVVQAPVDDTLPLRTRTLAPPVLFYSVWQTDLRLGDVQLSDGQIPAGVLFQPLGELYSELTLPMAAVGAGESTPFLRYGDGSLKCWASVSFNFAPSTAGVLAVSVHEGRNLAQTGVGKMDSYPSISLGVGDNLAMAGLGGSVAGRARVVETVARGTVCKEGGDNPMFNHEELLLWVDHEHCASSSRFVLTLFADVLGGSVAIGAVSLLVKEWTRDAICHEEALDIRSGGALGAITGRCMLTRQFYPAGMLTVRVVRGHALVQGDLIGGSDPYVKISLEGRMRSYATRTATIQKSGSEPYWDETFVFDVVDHAEMRLAVWDFDVMTEDDLVGEVLVDLGGVFKLGVRDAAVPLKRPTMFGTLEDCGLLVVEVDFVGPPGLAYPMLQSTRPAYTDAGRENRRLAGAADALRARKEKEAEAMMSEDAKRQAALAADMAGEKKEGEEEGEKKAGVDVLEDDDIEEAFRGLDLDSDLYLSRLELRHALTCMNEQITEMEIDEMVDMVDVDGDGQVAFYEFYQLCKSKEVSNPMWRPKAEEFYRARDWFAEGGVRGLGGAGGTVTSGGKELSAVSAGAVARAAAANAARAEELRRKEEKRVACEAAVIGMGLRIQELTHAYNKFKRHDLFKSGDRFADGQLSYEELHEVMTEARDPFIKEAPTFLKPLFHAFADGEGRVELFDMLLGLAAFVGCTRPLRIRFCFDLFDRDGSRTIDAKELMLILKGSHLAGTTSYLRNKAISILKAVNCKEDGSIDLEKFVVAANRFPSVFFPSYEARDASGGMIKPQVKSKEKKALEQEKATLEARKAARAAAGGKGNTLQVFIPGMEAEEEGAAGGAAGGGGAGKR